MKINIWLPEGHHFDVRNYEPRDGPVNVREGSSVFLVAIATTDDEADDVLFSFRASLDSELYLIGDMLGRKERSEGNGVGFKSANADKGGEVAEEEEEEEEDEWKPADEGRRVVYNKNKWFLVAEWYDVEQQEAWNRAAEIMIEDFQIAGGPILEYASPTERKIGPYGSRNVSHGFIYFYLFI